MIALSFFLFLVLELVSVSGHRGCFGVLFI